MSTKTCALPIPIKLNDKTVKKIELREPMAGELRGLKLTDVLQMDVTAMITLIPRVSTPILSEADVGALKPANLTALSATVVSFFADPAALPANS